MSLIASAKPAWEEIKSAIEMATRSRAPLKGASFYESPVVPVNLRLPAVVVTERSIAPIDQAYSWGVAQLRLRLEILSGLADPIKNLSQLEELADGLLDLFWNNRQLNGIVRDTDIDEITIGEVEDRPEHISATLVLRFTLEFQRPT